MAPARIPGPLNPDTAVGRTPAITPGPTGYNDQGDPNLTTRLGPGRGPTGSRDFADPSLMTLASARVIVPGTHGKARSGVAVSTGSKGARAATSISGIVAAGGPLNAATLAAVDAAGEKVPPQFHRYIAYEKQVNVGGSLAWRANNPGNLRGASTEIGKTPGQSGKFAIFATIEDGRAAQRALYLDRYGGSKVRDAIARLTPSFENDTKAYLAALAKAGVDLDKDVKSQIDQLMPAVEQNEGLIPGIVVARLP